MNWLWIPALWLIGFLLVCVFMRGARCDDLKAGEVDE